MEIRCGGPEGDAEYCRGAAGTRTWQEGWFCGRRVLNRWAHFERDREEVMKQRRRWRTGENAAGRA